MLSDFTPASEFVPADLDARTWENLAPLYAELIARPLDDTPSLQRLIMDRSELDAAAAEAASLLHINMTCHTDDGAATQAYLDHLENVAPRLKEAGFELDRKIVASPLAPGLDRQRYSVYLRSLRVGVDIFRQENVPIETELGRLDQEYSQVCGDMTVQFRAQERTLPQMSVYQEDTDRATRQEAWLAVMERRYRDHERLGAIFDAMISHRHRIALNAGFADYRDYVFKAKRRFEYTPDDCRAFAEGVERVCVPALRRLNAHRARALGLARLRPWDQHVDLKGRPGLRPFQTAQQLVERSSRLFHHMEPSLGRLFDSMRTGGCLDLETRKGKAPGGYQANRDRIRMPFIFMNAAGVQRDVETMVHEAGHAFHALLCRDEPLLAYRSDIPSEFTEVASMSMELASHQFLDEFYSDGDAERARRVHLEQIATLLPAVAMIDQFQHWLYTHPGHTGDERSQYWVALNDRFSSDLDWSGFEHYLADSWQRVLHLFSVPFYYIEYGIAQLGALQMWINYKRDPDLAIAGYRAALSLGGSRPIPDLYAAAGLRFDMGPAMIERLWGHVEEELARLPA